jgi:hypothetical protein
METSTPESARLVSSRNKAPETLENWPFTLAIIMCLTWNSAMECGSIFQVVVEVCDAASVAAIRFKLSILLISCLSMSIYLVLSCRPHEIQAFAPLLGTDKKMQGPPGRIVNITSSGAKVAIPLLGAYSASKFGLEGMSDALRRELMLFGIDVVIIEPGTVNTAMYDKGEKEDLSEFKQTEYWEAVQNFQKFIVTEARINGLSPERLGEAVHVALSAAKPKARYAVIPQRFKNWTLPKLLPARMLDAELAKQTKLTKL